MSEGLCWKCREYFIKNIPVTVGTWPFLHCHHEPKEKAKCWCDYPDRTVFVTFKHEADSEMCKIIYCPICGRKLS